MKISKNISYISMNDKTLISDSLASKNYELDESGSEIFNLILKGKEESEINQILANKYKGYEDQIRRDVNDFIKFLLENKIIEE